MQTSQKHAFSGFFGFSAGRLLHPRAAQWEFRDATSWGYTSSTIKNNKTKNFPKMIIFSMKNIFQTILKNRKFQKVTFFEKHQNFQKVNFFKNTSNFWKSQLFRNFWKKLTFWKLWCFSKKVTFWNFRFFKIFRKIFFIEKIKVYGKCLLFIFLSYLMHNFSAWHRATPTVPPVGAVNVPPKTRKIQKIHVFEGFWVTFSL